MARRWQVSIGLGALLLGCNSPDLNATEGPSFDPWTDTNDPGPGQDCPGGDDCRATGGDERGDESDGGTARACEQHDDCLPGEVCHSDDSGPGWCEGVTPVLACPSVPEYELVQTLLPLDDATSLRFVQADDDDENELVIQGPTSVVVADGTDQTTRVLPLHEGVHLLEIIDGDFDDDGIRELVGIDSLGQLSRWVADAHGDWFVERALASGIVNPSHLSVLDGDGDWDRDLVFLGDSGAPLVLWNDGLGNFGSLEELASDGSLAGSVDLVAVLLPEWDGDLVAVQTATQTLLRHSETFTELAFSDDALGQRHLAAADVLPDERDELVAYTAFSAWTLLEWRDGSSGIDVRNALVHPEALGVERHGIGDVEGDGVPNLVLDGPNGTTAISGIACYEVLPDTDSALRAFGDFDGDGQMDIAFALADPRSGQIHLALYVRVDD